MFLERLEIQGFKSFVDRTELRFGAGITVIVGPNGCGKTNITDAIRWVLGEQSAKQLRGETMEDVIFAGSLKRKPIGMAEVKLTLSNEAGALPTEFTQVEVGRRVFRSGASDYLFNGTSVRLRDIRDLFYGTGMGSHAYSVIERSMVDHVLSDASGHRRFLFEEAAGITKYKQRKREALNKLSSTETDLVRVQDILAEQDRELSSLARQVAKARRAQRLQEGIRDLDLRLSYEKHRDSFSRDRELGEKLDEEAARRQRATTELAALEAKLVEEKTAFVELETRMTSERQALAEAESLLARGENQRAVLEERRRGTEAQLAELREERLRIEERLAALGESEVTLRQEASARIQEADTTRRAVEVEEQALAALEQELETKRLAAEESQKLAVGLMQGESERKVSWEGARARLASLAERRADAESARQEIERSLAERDAERAAAEKEGERLAAELATAERTLAECRAAVEAGARAYDELAASEAERREGLAKLQARIETLQDLKDSMDGVAEGVQLLVTQRDRSRARGLVADFLDVDRGFVDPVEALVGPLLGAALVDTEADAHAALDLLRERGAGHASVVVLERGRDLQQRRPLKPGESGVVGWVAEGVRAAKNADGLVDVLVGDAVLVEGAEDAARLSKAYPAHRFVSRGGVVWSGGVASGGRPSDADRGLLRRGQELKKLVVERPALEEEFATAGERKLQALKDRDAAEARRSAAEEDRSRLAEAAQAAQARRESFTREWERLRAEAEARRTECEALSQEEKTLTEALHRAEADLEQLSGEAADAGRQLSSLEAEIRRLEETRRERRDAAQQVRAAWVEAGRAQSEAAAALARAEAERQELQAGLEARRRDAEQQEARLAETVRDASDLDRDLAARRESVAGLLARSQAATERAQTARAELEAREKQVGEARLQNQELAEFVHQIEMERLSRRNELERTLERLRVEYSIELESFTPPPLPEGETWNPEEAEERLQTLRQRYQSLGPVNLLALEDYERKKERHDFLTTQRADLLEAKDQLLEAIEKINRTASDLFEETFLQVERNFQDTFRTLFQGGECGLRRVGDDPLECEIEIMARPRGKSLQSIQLLSGGERALTAIALLFAIYLVKPSPFCILDEVDAPLDDANVDRFVTMLQRFSAKTQFIVVTHNKKTMEIAESLYGVTMQEPGVSRLVSVRFATPEVGAPASAAPAPAAESSNGSRAPAESREEELAGLTVGAKAD